MEPAEVQVFVFGSYSSALALFPPPATSTLPLPSSVAVWYDRGVAIEPAEDQVFAMGS